MFLRNKKSLYQGTIFLKSADRVAIEQFKSEISSLLKEQSNSKNNFVSITESKKSKYVTIFKSPFVYKKAKDTYRFQTYSSNIQFTIDNFVLLKVLVAKLENYKGIIDSSIKVSVLENELVNLNSQTKVVKFGTEGFKNLINL